MLREQLAETADKSGGEFEPRPCPLPPLLLAQSNNNLCIVPITAWSYQINLICSFGIETAVATARICAWKRRSCREKKSAEKCELYSKCAPQRTLLETCWLFAPRWLCEIPVRRFVMQTCWKFFRGYSASNFTWRIHFPPCAVELPWTRRSLEWIHLHRQFIRV